MAGFTGLKFRGRPPILIAGSVWNVVNFRDEYARAIMDRRKRIDEIVGPIVAQSVMTWEGRSPKQALDQDGNFQATDLDLLSFLVPMASRGAVIEIPYYRNRRRVVVRANERRIGATRFGPITSLVANSEVLSFSARIFDSTIKKSDSETGKETLGDFRTYMLVDCDGHWYDGWRKIVWDPIREENRFLIERGLWTGNTVYFENYVHPNRWQSVFSAHNLLEMMSIARIDDEAGFYRQEVKRLNVLGLEIPRAARPSYVPPDYEGATVPIKVSTIEMVLDMPEFQGSYAPVPDTEAGMKFAYERQKFLTYTLKPALQFGVRANQAAYFLYGGVDTRAPKVAAWLEGRTWKPWKAPRGRIVWNQMVLSQDVALRYRIWSKTEHVSAE